MRPEQRFKKALQTALLNMKLGEPPIWFLESARTFGLDTATAKRIVVRVLEDNALTLDTIARSAGCQFGTFTYKSGEYGIKLILATKKDRHLTTPGLTVKLFWHIQAAIERDGHFTRDDRRDAKRFGTNEPRIRRLIHGLRADGIFRRVSKVQRTQNAKGRWLSVGERYILAPSVGNDRTADSHRASEMTPYNAVKSDASLGIYAGADAHCQLLSPSSNSTSGALPPNPQTPTDHAKPNPESVERGGVGGEAPPTDDVARQSNGKQSASAATGNGGSGGKTPRIAKPETVEEKAVLDLYEQRSALRHDDEREWQHDRGKSLRSLRSFLYRRKGVTYESVVKRLTFAFDSDNVYPLKNHPFPLSQFFTNWDMFANGPLKKGPMKKSVAQVIREHDRPIREDIKEFGKRWWREQLDDHRVLDFVRFTGYKIDLDSDEVCLDFISLVGLTWEKHMMNGNTLSPVQLMTKVIDACMEGPRTPYPSDFIPHRDRLRREEES